MGQFKTFIDLFGYYVSFIEYKAIQSHSKSFRNIPWMPNTSSKSGQRLMSSQERVGEDKYD
jgi:hypothetical protein